LRQLLLASACAILLSPAARAVPSFARQLNTNCAACHTEFPILTDRGRQFKLNGYTMSAGQTDLPPLAIMLQPSFTQTNAGQPGGAAPGFKDNSNFALDQLSVFYAGRLFGPYADKIFGPETAAFVNKFGIFTQVTYDGVGKSWSWDNTELRFATNSTIFSKPAAWGVYLNNNPGLQDPWNTMPAWGFPFSSSALAPTPGAATMIDGGLAQQVVGLGAYLMFDNTFYFDVGAYHTLSTGFQKAMGVDPEGENQISSLAPYWRFAYTKSKGNQSYEIGMFGMSAGLYPGRDSSAGKDRITDWGLDSQYQVAFGKSDLAFLFSTIYEDQNWNASQKLGNATNHSDDLWTMKATVDYLYDKTYGGAISYFFCDGSHDPLAHPESPNGSPLSDGLVFQLNWLPFNKNGGPKFWPKSNVKFSIQYVVYDRFNGTSHNASDNNTLYLQAWIAF
jgi:hypothetical protein